jgi:hypothetical protein
VHCVCGCKIVHKLNFIRLQLTFVQINKAILRAAASTTVPTLALKEMTGFSRPTIREVVVVVVVFVVVVKLHPYYSITRRERN